MKQRLLKRKIIQTTSPKLTATEEPQTPENEKDKVSQASPKLTPTDEAKTPEKEDHSDSPKLTN